MQGRFGRKHLGSRDLGISHFRYASSTRNPGGHSHREQEEAYIVIAGSGRLPLDDELHDICLHVVALRSDHFVQRLDGQPGVVIRATDAVVNAACATHASPGAGTCSPAPASFADEYR
jgi:hypothetical protein